jgi:hypothetical protein
MAPKKSNPRAMQNGLSNESMKEFQRQMDDLKRMVEEKESPEDRVYRLRVEGYTPKQISEYPGVNKTAQDVENIILSMAEKSRQRLITELSIASIIEIDRMDHVLKSLWPAAALDGDLGAIDRVMQISKERRKLLGLDAPEARVSLQLTQGDNVDLSALSTDELKMFESLQKKLVEARRQKGGPRPAPGVKTKVVSEKPSRRLPASPSASAAPPPAKPEAEKA